jgi:hypothetical protein
MKPQAAQEQLTFYGKKTVPPVTRIEIERQPEPGTIVDKKLKKRLKKDPILIIKAGTRNDLWKPMATVRFAEPELAELAFKKLRDLRTLREYAWKELGMRPPPKKGHKLTNQDTKVIQVEKKKLAKKDLKNWLMDQRGSSVVDLSTTIDQVNMHIVERRDEILKNWELIQALAKDAADGKLAQLEKFIQNSENSIKTADSFMTKRALIKQLTDQRNQRYRLLRALKVVKMVNQKQRPELLEQMLLAEQKKEQLFQKRISGLERRVESQKDAEDAIKADMDASVNDAESQEHLAKLTTAKRLGATAERQLDQLEDDLKACHQRQVEILERLEDLAMDLATENHATDATSSTLASVEDPVLTSELEKLIENVVSLQVDEKLERLYIDDINTDFEVKIYWEDLNDRKFAEDWPENSIHKPMGLRPFNLKFVASLPTQLEEFVPDAENFVGSEGIDDGIKLRGKWKQKVIENVTETKEKPSFVERMSGLVNMGAN